MGGNVVAYAIYHDGGLAQAVVLDEELWTKESGTERPKHNITLGGLGGVEKVRVRRLTRDSGTAQHSIGWAGQRWSHENKAF